MAGIISWLSESTIATSSIVGIVSFIAGTYFKAKIEKSVQHNLDKELENLRSDLQLKSGQINALRSSVLSGMTMRREALDKRRLAAIEKLWAAVIGMGAYKLLSRFASRFEMDAAMDSAAKQDAEGEKTRQLADHLWKMSGLDTAPEIPRADTERPFLSPMAWALFSTYRAILTLPIAQFSVLRTGAPPKLLKDPSPTLDLAKLALPHQAAFIDQYGVASLDHLVDEIEEKLLALLMSNLVDPTSDKESITQAASIIEAVEKAASAQADEIDFPFKDTKQENPIA